jgi:hypothetical protein
LPFIILIKLFSSKHIICNINQSVSTKTKEKMMSFNEKATPKSPEAAGASSTIPNLNNTTFGRLSRIFTKITPAQLEIALITIISGFAAFTIFRNDIMMPGYSKAVQGDKESYGADPINSYRLEPIFDENGKLKAMRKIRVTPPE